MYIYTVTEFSASLARGSFNPPFFACYRTVEEAVTGIIENVTAEHEDLDFKGWTVERATTTTLKVDHRDLLDMHWYVCESALQGPMNRDLLKRVLYANIVPKL